MCTEFNRSAYRILQLLDQERPTSARDIYTKLRQEHVMILLGARNSLAEFLEALCAVQELAKKDQGYVLTANGIRERNRLGKLVKESSQHASAIT